MAMAKEEGEGGSDINWNSMLKCWNRDKGIHHPRFPYGESCLNHPANLLDGVALHDLPTPQWRGKIQNYFLLNPPPKGYDISDRVYAISHRYVLPHESEYSSEDECEDESEAQVKAEEELEFLNELQEYVEFVDVAKLLHSDNCLFVFLHCVLRNEHAGVRAKGAEVVTTMVQNNPTSQRLVIKEEGLKLLLQNFTSDPNATSRTKALGAIYSLIQNNNSGITEFRRESGYAALKNALISGSVCVREVLNLIHCLLHENSSDRNIVAELGLPHIMMHLASSDKAEEREAALRGLLVLARDEEGGNNGQLVKNDDKLKQVLQERIEGISAMALDDLGAAREERQLVDSLWNACYNEPSSLGEKGLLVLPGEDAPVPDVASKLFEPPLKALDAVEATDGNSSLGEKGILLLPGENAPAHVASKLFEPPLKAWAAAAEAADGKSVSEKDCNIVTELVTKLGLHRIMMHLASSDDAEVRESALRGLLVLARDEDGNSGSW